MTIAELLSNPPKHDRASRVILRYFRMYPTRFAAFSAEVAVALEATARKHYKAWVSALLGHEGKRAKRAVDIVDTLLYRTVPGVPSDGWTGRRAA